MIIRCPECQFERSIDSSKIPSSAAIATCPKCRHRFRFRDLAPGMADAAGDSSVVPAAPAAARAHPAVADAPPVATDAPDAPDAVDAPGVTDANGDLPATFSRPSFQNSSGQNSSGQISSGQSPSGPAASAAQPHDAPAFDNDYAGEHDHVGEPRPISAADAAPSPASGSSTPDAPDAPDAPNAPDAPRAPVAQQPSHGHTNLSRPGDDPLPPGAVIPGRGSSPARDEEQNGQLGHQNGRGNEPRRPGSPRDIWDAVASVGDRWRKQSGRESRPGDAGDDAPHAPQDGRGDGMFPPHASGPERDQRDGRDGRDRRDARHPGERDAPLPPWAASARNEVPWENLDRLGFFPGLYQTILRVMLAAPRFFSGVRSTGSLKRPVAFYLLVGIFQSLAERLWYLMSMRAFGGFIEDPQLKAWMGSVTHDMSLPMTLLLSPFTLLLQLAVLAGLYHFMIRLVEPRAADLPTTVRVISYSAAPTVLSVVPLVGPVVGSLWFVICTFVGVKYAHRLPWSRTALAIGPLLGLGFALTVQLLRMFMSSAPM